MNRDISKRIRALAVPYGGRRVLDTGLVAVFHNMIEGRDYDLLFPVEQTCDP